MGFTSIYIVIDNWKIKRPKTHYIKLILIIINFIFDLKLTSILCQKGQKDSCLDCLDNCVKINNDEKRERINNKIAEIERKNNLLKEENQNLIELIKCKVSNNIDDKKIEVILRYVKNNYKENFSPNLLHKYLLEETRDKFKEVIDKNKLRNIFLCYIKEKFEECLTCPLTGDIFINPVIAPEGQTFDHLFISKIVNDKGENPTTRNKLSEKELIDNLLIKELSVIFKNNEKEFSMESIKEMKKLLINHKNNKLYSNPVAIQKGDKRGETEEGIGLISKYSNKAILNIIEQNKEYLSDEFLEDLEDNNVNNLLYNEETLNTDTRLNINTNS